jgi:hypothetical protein
VSPGETAAASPRMRLQHRIAGRQGRTVLRERHRSYHRTPSACSGGSSTSAKQARPKKSRAVSRLEGAAQRPAPGRGRCRPFSERAERAATASPHRGGRAVHARSRYRRPPSSRIRCVSSRAQPAASPRLISTGAHRPATTDCHAVRFAWFSTTRRDCPSGLTSPPSRRNSVESLHLKPAPPNPDACPQRAAPHEALGARAESRQLETPARGFEREPIVAAREQDAADRVALESASGVEGSEEARPRRAARRRPRCGPRATTGRGSNIGRAAGARAASPSCFVRPPYRRVIGGTTRFRRLSRDRSSA